MAQQALRRMGLLGIAAALVLSCNGNASAETTKERILREGRIVVGIHNRSPWGFRDDKTGEPTGWHPDILKAAFAELGVTNLEFQVTEFGALIPGLLAGRFDAAMTAVQDVSSRDGRAAALASMTPVLINSPTVKRSESPGRKNPMSRPHSAKMMATAPQSAQAPSASSNDSGLSQEGPSAGCASNPASGRLSTAGSLDHEPVDARIHGSRSAHPGVTR